MGSSGETFISDPFGRKLAEAGSEPAVLVAELDRGDRVAPLVVLGVLIWNFSSTWAGRNETKISFTEFLQRVQEKQVASVKITGNEIVGEMGGVESVTLTKDQVAAHTHAFQATTALGSQPTPWKLLTRKRG